MRALALAITLALLGAALSLPGCNTVKGVGTDIEQVAQHTQDFMEGK